MRLHPSGCLAAGVALLLGAAVALGQGTFQNLNFERATIILNPSNRFYPYAAYATNAVPGWKFFGGIGYPDILYNDVALGSPCISIHDANDQYGFTPIQGQYSVYLQRFGGYVAIAQTGRLPSNAQSLTFWSYFTGFEVTFAGQVQPYISIGTGPNYTIYGGDISAFAGQTGELRFSGNGFLDNIQFSTQPIPEPGVSNLSALGALLLGWRVLRRPRFQRVPNFCCSECASHIPVSIGSPRRRIAERFRYAMTQLLLLPLILGVMLTTACRTESKSASTALTPVSSEVKGSISKAEAEGIILQHLGNPANMRIVNTRLAGGVWRVLVERLPSTPGAHTVYEIRAADGAIVGTMPGI